MRDEAAEKCPTRDASPPLVLAFLQAQSATTKRYHQTRHPPLEVALSACVVCLLMKPFCKQTTKRKTANAESRKPGNEPHVHCPAYNLIRNSSNKAYY